MGLLKRLRRTLKKVARPAIAAAGGALFGPAGAVVATKVAKGLGAFKPKTLPNIPPTSVQGTIEKYATKRPEARIKTKVKAETMPGGAPIGPATRRTRSRRGKRLTNEEKAQRRALGASVRAGKRKPPSGGLDLKGLSASWKAAGKPGTWQDWIRSHK